MKVGWDGKCLLFGESLQQQYVCNAARCWKEARCALSVRGAAKSKTPRPLPLRYQSTGLDLFSPSYFLSVTFALVLLALHLLTTLSPAEDEPEQTLSYLPWLFHLTFQGSSATPTTNAIIPTLREIVMIKDKRTNRQRHGMYPQQGSRFVSSLWKLKHKRRKDKRSGPANSQTLHNVLSSFRAAAAAEKRWKLTLMQVQARLTAAMPSFRFAEHR